MYARDMSNEKSEFDKREELFFYNPEKDEDDYDRLYRVYYPGDEPPARSPLYRLRRELWGHYKNNRWISAMLFPSIITEGLVKYIFSPVEGETIKVHVEEFIKKYFEFSMVELRLTRLYRNAQEHNFGFLIERAKRNDPHTGEAFKDIMNQLRNDGHLINNNVAFIKVHFPLSTDFSTVARISKVEPRDGHLFIETEINPKKYIEKLEDAILKFRSDVVVTPILKERFLSSITRDNWVRVYYRPKAGL